MAVKGSPRTWTSGLHSHMQFWSPEKLGRQLLLRICILGLAWVAAFSSRLFAVIRFESIIHEFDPW